MSTPNPIPHLPPFYNMNYTDKEGNLTPDSTNYNDIMNQILRVVIEFFNEGVQIPQKTTAEITAYGADANVPAGTMWFDSQIFKLKVKVGAGAIEKITSTP